MSEKNTENPTYRMERLMDIYMDQYRRSISRLHNRKLWLWFAVVLSLLSGVLSYILISKPNNYGFSAGIFALSITITGLVFVIFAFIAFLIPIVADISMHAKIFDRELDILTQNRIIEDDMFINSIKMSYKYLDQYYLQTKEHAHRGFLVTVWVSIFGAVLIGAGIIAMFFEHVTPSYITCASGVITEFIAAIFFYL